MTSKRSFTMINNMNVQKAKRKVQNFFYQNKRMPSYQEICDLFAFSSKKTAFELVKKLITIGFLQKDDKGKLIPKNIFPTIPLLGSIQAGLPGDAWQESLGTITIGQYFPGDPDKAYALKVSGDSMIEAGIFPDDLVIVEKDKEAREGDVVVAYIDNEFTLKSLKRIKNKYFLTAANKKYPNLRPKNELTVFGVVKTVIRNYQ